MAIPIIEIIKPVENDIYIYLHPTFRWHYSGSYLQKAINIRISTNYDMTDIVWEKTLPWTKKLFFFYGTLGMGTYFLQVRAKDTNFQWSAWSIPRKFRFGQLTEGEYKVIGYGQQDWDRYRIKKAASTITVRKVNIPGIGSNVEAEEV